MTRIGILGGTFDPIHVGHLEAASAAQRAFSLEPVMLMPARLPPHRSIDPRASVFHRFAMAALGAADRRMAISDLELRREGPSYTSLTLESLHHEGFAPAEIYFITGSDAFAEIATWHDYPRLFELANFVVVSRPGGPRSEPIPSHHSPIPNMTTSVLFIEAPTPDVSSTEIRRRIGAGESIDGLVPPSVADHIRRHRLYVPATVAATL